MDQEQIDIICAQTLQRSVHCILLLIERGPQFGLQKNFLSGQARLSHGPSHSLFIHIGVGRINQAAASLQRRQHGDFRLIGRQQKGADPGHRHFDFIV